jgi:DNA-binding MarR family transcriptional regulator/N-acetylglutamate synthase-like GNAT family acetyltransferase
MTPESDSGLPEHPAKGPPISPELMRDRVAAVRRFNRFYTRRIGVLNEAVFGSAFSLGEMRLLWELGHQDGASASKLQETLGVDPASVSRILRNFRGQGWVEATPAEHDARIRYLHLTAKGRKVLVPLELASSTAVRGVLRDLSAGQQERLVDAMRAIETLLAEGRDPLGNYGLRDPQPGDFGWVVARHGEIYAREYGWGAKLEGLVAEIVARYVRDLKTARERCWIAERSGVRVGCVFVMEHSPTVAQLRLLLVDPSARGSGLGARLVEECVGFARAAGYRRLFLWTHSNLKAARHLYVKSGFRLVKREKHRSFGHDLMGETYSLSLTTPAT